MTLVPRAGERCVVCDTPLTARDAPARPTCGARDCRWRYQSTAPHERCLVCARPLTSAQRASRLCDAQHCREHTFRVARERRRREREALLAEARALRDARAADAGVAEPDAFVVSLVGANRGRDVTPLPRDRRRAYRARLATLIAEALRRRAAAVPYESASAFDEVVVSDEVGALFGRACAYCLGGCCTGGGDHAHLTADTLRRWLDAHPSARPRDALAAYLAHLPAESYATSCVNHTALGCALPRELRSDTCNRYFCGGLVELRRRAETGDVVRTFFAAEHDGALSGGVFLEAAAHQG